MFPHLFLKSYFKDPEAPNSEVSETARNTNGWFPRVTCLPCRLLTAAFFWSNARRKPTALLVNSALDFEASWICEVTHCLPTYYTGFLETNGFVVTTYSLWFLRPMELSSVLSFTSICQNLTPGYEFSYWPLAQKAEQIGDWTIETPHCLVQNSPSVLAQGRPSYAHWGCASYAHWGQERTQGMMRKWSTFGYMSFNTYPDVMMLPVTCSVVVMICDDLWLYLL